MARTLWGNILETLAGVGLNTAGKIGVEAFTGPMQGQRVAQQEVLKSLLPAMATEQDPTKAAEIASRIKEISGVDFNLNRPETNAAGTEVISPMGAKLTAPSLETLAPEYKPVPGFIRPGLTSDQVMGQTLGKLPEAERAEMLGLKFGAGLKPADLLRIQLAERRDARMGEQFQQAQQANETFRRESLAMREEALKGNIEMRKLYLMSNINNQKTMQGLLGDKLEAGARAQLDKSLNHLNKLYQDPTTKPDVLKKATSDHNALLGSITAKHPELGDFFNPMDVEMSGLIFKTPKLVEKTRGVKATPSNTEPPSSYIANYNMALKANANNPDTVKQIIDRAKSKYPNYNWQGVK